MSKKHYLPRADNDRLAWLQNFLTKLTPIATTFGVSPAELAALGDDLSNFTYFINVIDIFKRETQERVHYKDILANGPIGTPLGAIPSLPTLPADPTPVASGVFVRVGMLVQRIKNHTAYNESIGRDLGIIGAEQVLTLSEVKPIINKVIPLTDKVEIHFFKGLLHSVEVFCRIESEEEEQEEATVETASVKSVDDAAGLLLWEKIGIASRSPYLDRRMNKLLKPEVRLYKLRYLFNDEPVGLFSDIARVIVEIGR